MADNTLMSVFKKAVARVEAQTQVPAFTQTIGFLENNFTAACDVADEQTRQQLIEALCAFTVKTARRQPANVTAITCFTDAVILLTGAIAKADPEKTYVPESFKRDLTVAALQMGARDGGSAYIIAAQAGAQKIIEAARVFDVPAQQGATNGKRLVIKKPSA